MSDDQPRDPDGKFASFMGAHNKLDKLAANAHAKAESIRPPTFGTTKIGNRTMVTATKNGQTENWTQHKTAKEANARAAKLQANHAEEQRYQQAGRARRAERARGYLQTRAGRDAKYGKQLKFSF